MDKKLFRTLPLDRQNQMIENALKNVLDPHEIFGYDNPDKVYHLMVKQLHPDLFPREYQLKATAIFQSFQALWERLKDEPNPMITYATSQRGTYEIYNQLGAGDCADIHRARDPQGKIVIAKVLRDNNDEEYLQNECIILQDLASLQGWEALKNYVPEVVETPFESEDGKLLTILRYGERWGDVTQLRTLEQIAVQFNQRLDPRHIGWMWNRIMAALVIPHQYEYLHGALTPDNLLIDAANHGLMVIDWVHGASFGDKIKSFPVRWKDLYPPEVIDKAHQDYTTDFYVAARSMLWSMQGLDRAVPEQMRYYFEAISRADYGVRMKIQPRELYDLWNEMLHETLGWKKEFVPLELETFDWNWLT